MQLPIRALECAANEAEYVAEWLLSRFDVVEVVSVCYRSGVATVKVAVTGTVDTERWESIVYDQCPYEAFTVDAS